MKTFPFTVIVIIVFTFLLQPDVIAQRRNKTPSYMRLAIGLNYLGAVSQDTGFSYFKPSKYQSFPSLRLDTKPILIQSKAVDYSFMAGMGFTKTGYKYTVNTDSVFEFKKSYMHFLAGFGTTFKFKSGRTEFPLNLSLVGFVQLGSSYKIYYNSNLYSTNNFDMEGFNFGCTLRADQTIIPGKLANLAIFYSLDYGFTDKFSKYQGIIYRPITHNIGLSLSFINGVYSPIYL